MNTSMVRIHGGREKNSPKSLLEKKVSAFPSACGGAGSASAPVRRHSGGLDLQRARWQFRFERRRREGNGAGRKKEPPPLPSL